MLHPAAVVAALARPGRVLVVDEAFADTRSTPASPESLAGRRDLPGLVVLRSLTKTWGLAGLRIGYLLAAAGPGRDARRRAAAVAGLHARARRGRGLRVARGAVAAERRIAAALAADRAHLVAGLRALPGVTVAGEPASSFVLVRLRRRRRGADWRCGERGYAVRRGDTFPGLGPDWLRIAVRDTATTDAFVAALPTCCARVRHRAVTAGRAQ